MTAFDQASPATRREASRRRRGATAPLLPPAVAYAVLTAIGIVLPSALAGEAPYSSDAGLLASYAHHAGEAHLSAFLLLASAVPFVVFTAIAAHRIRVLGLDVPGRLIALAGGVVAAALLALAGLATLALTQPHVADSPAVVRALSGLAFAAGGPGFVVFSGLLLAGISVPVLVGRFAPRWVGWFGVIIAVVCELATLTALTGALDPLLPIGRFGGLVWLLAVAVTLPARRVRRAS